MPWPAASLRRPRATSRDLSPGENRQVPQRPGACAIIRGRGLTRGAILTMGDDGALLLVRFTIGDDGEIPCFIQFVIIHAVQSFTIVHEHPQSSDVARHDRARSHAMPHDVHRTTPPYRASWLVATIPRAPYPPRPTSSPSRPRAPCPPCAAAQRNTNPAPYPPCAALVPTVSPTHRSP